MNTTNEDHIADINIEIEAVCNKIAAMDVEIEAVRIARDDLFYNTPHSRRQRAALDRQLAILQHERKLLVSKD